MRKFLTPDNKFKFIKWLLTTAINNSLTIVIEYSDKETYNFLIRNGKEVSLPFSTKHEYDSTCSLTAITQPNVNDDFITELTVKSHVLSVHNESELIFLIADDYHEECFSGTTDFFERYYPLYPETI